MHRHSASACAIGRFQSTVTLNYQQGLTYEASAIVMWCLSENTCALIVFCAPSFPKFFADLRRLGTLYETIGWWMGSHLGSSPTENVSSPLSNDGKPQPAIEFAADRGITAQRQYIPLDSYNDLESFQTDGSFQLNDRSNQNLGSGGVLRTTEFVAQTTHATSADTRHDLIHRQHPWT